MNAFDPQFLFWGFAVIMIPTFFVMASFFNPASHRKYGERLAHFRRGSRIYRNAAYAKLYDDRIIVTAGFSSKVYEYPWSRLREVGDSDEVSFPMYANQRQFVHDDEPGVVLEFGGEWGRLVSESVAEHLKAKEGG